MKVTDTIKYVGVNDHDIDLFEGQYVVPLGMAYNSYVILDEKIVVMDTVDARFTDEWLGNIKKNTAAATMAVAIVIIISSLQRFHCFFTLSIFIPSIYLLLISPIISTSFLCCRYFNLYRCNNPCRSIP